MQAGEIGDIQLQTTVHLTLAKISYRPDFKYFDLQEKQSVWVEAKGYPTDLWKMKKRLWKHYGPGPLHIYVRGGRGTVKISEVIIPSGENLT